MNQQEANQDAMDMMLFPSESMEEVDGIAGIREVMELFLAEPPENENMERCDDFEVKENEKDDLINTFRKQNSGSMMMMMMDQKVTQYFDFVAEETIVEN
jgi:hypothetical protein